MSKTLIGRFDKYDAAEQTAQVLISHGIAAKDISVTRERPYPDDFGPEGRTPLHLAPGVLAVFGTVVGTVIGLIMGAGYAPYLGGLTQVVPPGGTILSMFGWLFAGAGIGAALAAVLGGVIGAILQVLKVLVAGEQSGARLQVRLPDDKAGLASAIMQRNHALSVEQGAR